MPGKTDGWSAKLTRSITLKNGTNLVTLADVRAFILKEPDHIQERASWQRAVELLIEAAETGRGIEGATERVDSPRTNWGLFGWQPHQPQVGLAFSAEIYVRHVTWLTNS